MASNSNPCGLSVSAIAQLNNAVGQQTAAFRIAIDVCKNYSKTIGQSTNAGKAEALSMQKSTVERNKVVQALAKEGQAGKSAAIEQVFADLHRIGGLLGVTSEAGKMAYETQFGKFSGEDSDTQKELMQRAADADWFREQKEKTAYINGIKGKDPEKEAQTDLKMNRLDEALSAGDIDRTQYDKARRGLGVKRDGDFMLDLNDKLLESARDSAGKIQDVLGTKMYDFVADKFDKMGLSFLNNVAKMATSAASAKLMETLLGGDFMSGKNGGGLGGWIGAAGSWISGLFGGGASAGAASGVAQAFPISMNAKGNAFTNGMVSSPVAFPMGVMGEAGPEAIMPLHRGSDGSLGIRAAFPNVGGDTGQMGGGVSVNVYVQDGNVSSESESGEGGWKQFGQQIGEYVTQLVDRRMTQSYRQGGLAWQASNNRLAGA